MKAKLLLGTLIVSSALITGCNATTAKSIAAEASPYGSAAASITAAVAANKMAAEMNNEWRDTADMITEAQELAKAGDHAKAIALADKAKAQAENAQLQAKAQLEAGPRF